MRRNRVDFTKLYSVYLLSFTMTVYFVYILAVFINSMITTIKQEHLLKLSIIFINILFQIRNYIRKVL